MRNGVNVFAAVLGGVVIGLAVGVLFTPEKGSEVRARIAEAIKAHVKRRNIRFDENK